MVIDNGSIREGKKKDREMTEALVILYLSEPLIITLYLQH